MKYTLLEGAIFSALLATATVAVAQTVPTVIAVEQETNQHVPEVEDVITVAPPAQIEETPEVTVAPEPVGKQANTSEIECLARNIYFEARGEGRSGMRAVGHVTMNRVESRQFRKTVCGVVYQSGQFHWVGNGATPRGHLWTTSREVAHAIYTGEDVSDPTNGATYFHNPSSRPSWSRTFRHTATIGNHRFYRP